MEDKIQYIEDLARRQVSKTYLRAFIGCLSPEETCAALDLAFTQEEALRQALFQKIVRDMNDEVRECHRELCQQLMQLIYEQPWNKKRFYAPCLDALFPVMPEDLQDQVIQFFLALDYIIFRRKGYHRLADRLHANPELLLQYRPLVEALWETHQDVECAVLMIDYFPLDYLTCHSAILGQSVASVRSKRLQRLYIKIGQKTPEKLEELARLDPVTYAYVCAMLHQPLSEEEALSIFEASKRDYERLGLVVWSFGRLGLWLVLQVIQEEFPQL